MSHEDSRWTLKRKLGVLVAVVGLVAGVITIVDYFDPDPAPPGPGPEPQPVPPASFEEQIEGDYRLESWTPATRPVALGARSTGGSLEVRGTMFSWSVELVQTHQTNPGRATMTARHQLNLGTRQLLGVRGGAFNNTSSGPRWGQASSDVQLAFRGWDTGQPDDPFRVTASTSRDGTVRLQMQNSRGTFTWVR